MLIFVFGLIIGSFLNVCIYRIPRKETIIYGFSRCPNCGEKLVFLDLVPLFSYLYLGGKCRYCHSPISWRYPLIELLTGLIFFLSYLRFGLHPFLVKYLSIFSLLLVISFIDLDIKIIPNQLVLILVGWGLLWQLFWPELPWLQALLGALLGGGSLLIIALVSRGGMGGGDIKLMFAAGLILGSLTILALFLAFVTGALGGGFLLATGIKNRKEPIAFGPFLAFGIMIASLWGSQLVEIYLNASGLK